LTTDAVGSMADFYSFPKILLFTRTTLSSFYQQGKCCQVHLRNTNKVKLILKIRNGGFTDRVERIELDRLAKT
jgi:hypothetical protein